MRYVQLIAICTDSHGRQLKASSQATLKILRVNGCQPFVPRQGHVAAFQARSNQKTIEVQLRSVGVTRLSSNTPNRHPPSLLSEF